MADDAVAATGAQLHELMRKYALPVNTNKDALQRVMERLGAQDDRPGRPPAPRPQRRQKDGRAAGKAGAGAAAAEEKTHGDMEEARTNGAAPETSAAVDAAASARETAGAADDGPPAPAAEARAFPRSAGQARPGSRSPGREGAGTPAAPRPAAQRRTPSAPTPRPAPPGRTTPRPDRARAAEERAAADDDSLEGMLNAIDDMRKQKAISSLRQKLQEATRTNREMDARLKRKEVEVRAIDRTRSAAPARRRRGARAPAAVLL